MLLAGFAGGHFLTRGSATALEPQREAVSPTVDITPALVDLQHAVERLTTELQERPAAPASARTREPVQPSSELLAKLTAAIERLDTTLDTRMTSGAAPIAHVEAWKGAGFASRAAMQQRCSALRQGNAPNWSDTMTQELVSLHLGWSRNDLFERYGAPTYMNSVPGALIVAYALGDGGSRPTAVFTTSEGIVTRVYLQP